MSVEALKAFCAKFEEWLQNGLEIVKEFGKTLEITPKELVEEPNSEFLTRKDKLLARLIRNENSIAIFPVESLRIKVNDPAITWLKNQPLKAATEKHGISFSFTENKGILRSIRLEGPIEELERLLQPIGWALQKAGAV